MNKNMGTTDKIVRVVLGVALLALIFVLEGPVRWIGLAGAVLLATVIMSWCPIYTIFGMRTDRGK